MRRLQLTNPIRSIFYRLEKKDTLSIYHPWIEVLSEIACLWMTGHTTEYPPSLWGFAPCDRRLLPAFVEHHRTWFLCGQITFMAYMSVSVAFLPLLRNQSIVA